MELAEKLDELTVLLECWKEGMEKDFIRKDREYRKNLAQRVAETLRGILEDDAMQTDPPKTA